MNKIFKIAIVGRPNVGKSTLFNRLTTKKTSITKDEEGVTRDYITAHGKLFDINFTLFDTAGLIPNSALLNQQDFFIQIKDKLIDVVKECDVVFFICDVKQGVISTDINFSRWLHKICDQKKIILIGNKAENQEQITAFRNEKGSLWAKNFFPVSAYHYLGFEELYQHLKRNFYDDFMKNNSIASNDEHKNKITITMMGRPNVGKSTLLNSMLGKDRSIVSNIAGTTVDAVVEHVNYKDYSIKIVDTAGLRKSSKIKKEEVEGYAVKHALDAMHKSDILLLILDASALIVEKQDLKIFSTIASYDKIPIILLNKMDLLNSVSKKQLSKQMELIFSKKMSQIRKVKSLPISALKNKGVSSIWETAISLYETSQKEITTGALNRWLQRAVYDHVPPKIEGKMIKLKYAVQTGKKPIKIKIFLNANLSLTPSYVRYLVNNFAEHFSIFGIPIKIEFSHSANPYVKST